MGTVIYLIERSITMLKQDLISRNPLRLIAGPGQPILSEGEFGAVVARAGVGKTAFLVQVAMDSLLSGKNVLHISLDQPVKKVCLWYEEVFNAITNEYDFKNTTSLWEEILPHRFIMTFKSRDFSIDTLEERITDLVEQGIFYPQICLIDGLHFDETVRELLSEMKLLSRDQGFPCWFSIRTHRDESRTSQGMPDRVAQVADLFEVIFELAPSMNEVGIKILKDVHERLGDIRKRPDVVLDPATFLMKKIA